MESIYVKFKQYGFEEPSCCCPTLFTDRDRQISLLMDINKTQHEVPCCGGNDCCCYTKEILPPIQHQEQPYNCCGAGKLVNLPINPCCGGK